MPYIAASHHSALIAATVNLEGAIDAAKKDVELRIAEHDGRLAEGEEQYIAGLRDAMIYLDKRVAALSVARSVVAEVTTSPTLGGFSDDGKDGASRNRVAYQLNWVVHSDYAVWERLCSIREWF